MESIFDQKVHDLILNRIEKLTPNSTPLWGKMSVSQMLAHCNAAFELVFTDHFVKAEAFNRLINSSLMINLMVSDEPYPQNVQTAPQLLIHEEADFENEKKKLISFLNKIHNLGAAHFEDNENMAFGSLNAYEWHNVFYKHLHHHLQQFNV